MIIKKMIYFLVIMSFLNVTTLPYFAQAADQTTAEKDYETLVKIAKNQKLQAELSIFEYDQSLAAAEKNLLEMKKMLSQISSDPSSEYLAYANIVAASLSSLFLASLFLSKNSGRGSSIGMNIILIFSGGIGFLAMNVLNLREIFLSQEVDEKALNQKISEIKQNLNVLKYQVQDDRKEQVLELISAVSELDAKASLEIRKQSYQKILTIAASVVSVGAFTVALRSESANLFVGTLLFASLSSLVASLSQEDKNKILDAIDKTLLAVRYARASLRTPLESQTLQ